MGVGCRGHRDAFPGRFHSATLLQVLAVIVFTFKQSGKRMRLLLYPEGDPFALRIFTNPFRDLPVNARLRINWDPQFVIGPTVNVQEERLALLPDVGADRRRKPGQDGGSKVESSLISIPGIQSRREISIPKTDKV